MPGGQPQDGNGAAEVVETVVKDEHDKVGRNDPCWCGSGKKYKKCHGAYDPVREFIDAFNERDLDAFVATLDPEVEIHSMQGLRKGVEAARAVGDAGARGVQQTIELEELYAEGTATVVVALIFRRWRWAEDGSPAGEDEMAWLFELRDGRVRSWRPFEDRAEALPGARTG